MRSKTYLVILIHSLWPVIAFAQNYATLPAPAQDQPIALVGGTIHPVSIAAIESGSIVFEQGKITAVGEDIAISEGTRIIDISGKHVYPGLIDANSILGLIEIGSVRATRDYAETGQINPNVRAEAAINPDSEILPVTRSNGVALALSVPRSGLISGTSALIMLDGWTWEQMTLKAPVALHLDWPSMRLRSGWWITKSDEEQRKGIQENLKRVQEAFDDARAYKKAREAVMAEKTVSHETDSRWEAMMPVFERKLPVIINADNLREIEAAVRWAAEEKIDIIIAGGYDAWRASDLLKEKNIPVIYGPVHQTPQRSWEAYDTPFTIPLKLHEAGVKFCIAEFGGSNARNLPYHAAMAAAYGLPEDIAMRSITLSAAEILGVADRVGSLEAGKDATIIVCDGNPLEITTGIELMFIQGREIDLDNKQKILYRKYSEKYRRLNQASDGHDVNATVGDSN